MIPDTFISRLTAKSQTVIPMAVRRSMGLRPGDMIRYRIKGKKIEIEKLDTDDRKDDPFVAFTEWASPADEEAYKDL